jgi:hypothetical protein
MGTRSKDAERRQISLTIEALEDRFLLSGAVVLCPPSSANQPTPALLGAPNNAAQNGNVSVRPQEVPGRTSAWPIPAYPSNPISAQRDAGVDDDDLPGMTDRDAARNSAAGFPLPSFACNNITGTLDFALPSRAAGQMDLSAANLMPFLPLVSASGIGAMKMVPIAPLSSISAVSGNEAWNNVPVPGREEIPQSPTVPQAPPSFLPPLAEKPADSPPPLSGRFAALLPIDVEAIQRGMDVFFQQLGDLSEEWRDSRVLEKLAPWLLAASLAGYGWLRLRDRRDRCLTDILPADSPKTAPSIFLPGGEG